MSSNGLRSHAITIVFAVAGLVWLGIALYNVRQGGSFSWGGVALFLGLILVAELERKRRRAQHRAKA